MANRMIKSKEEIEVIILLSVIRVIIIIVILVINVSFIVLTTLCVQVCKLGAAIADIGGQACFDAARWEWDKKNPAYGRHRFSRPMRIIGPIYI